MTAAIDNARLLAVSPDDIFIVVTGVTGAGKSSFIAQCCEGLGDIVGHGLFSQTQKCALYSFTLNGKTVRLVDTPGFDDSKRTGTDVLKEIAEWLIYAWSQKVKLSGMIYLHSLAPTRMGGSNMVNLQMFKKVTGLENMDRVVLATTMWDKTPEPDAKRREMELLSEQTFWGELVAAGSKPARFMNDTTSAHAIVEKLVSGRSFVPSLQREMAVEDKKLDETAAGKALNVELTEAREKSAREMKQMEEQLNTALHEKDMAYAQQVMDMQSKISKEMEKLAQNQKDMQVKSDELLQKKEEEIRKTREEMAQMKKNLKERDKKHADDIAKMQEGYKLSEEEMKKELASQKEKLESDMSDFRVKTVNGMVQLVGEMDDYYAQLSQKNQQKMQEDLAQMKASNPGPPPAYSNPQPIFIQPPAGYGYGESGMDDMVVGAMKKAAIVSGGSLLGAAVVSACAIM